MNKSTATSFALSVAALLTAACNKDKASPKEEQSSSEAVEVMCLGVNECKGKSACHTATSACAGQNECKGKGWITLSKSDCEAKGGKPGGKPPM